MRRALGTMTPWDVFEKATEHNDVYAHEMNGHHQLNAEKTAFLEQNHSGSAHVKREGEGFQAFHPAQSHPKQV